MAAEVGAEFKKKFPETSGAVADVIKGGGKDLTMARGMEITQKLRGQSSAAAFDLKITGMGGPMSSEAGNMLEALNTSLKDDVAKAGTSVLDRAGAWWSKMSTGGKAAVAGVGALLGLRIISSYMFGNEPSVGPGMRITPELMARHAMQGSSEGAPLPPDPMVMPGMHQSMQRPYVPFSPPTARVHNSLATSPSLSMDITEQGSGDSAHSIGMNLGMVAGSYAGAPLTGVFAVDSHEQSGGKIDRVIETEQIATNRIYNPKVGLRG
jgi:hypothetical protein